MGCCTGCCNNNLSFLFAIPLYDFFLNFLHFLFLCVSFTTKTISALHFQSSIAWSSKEPLIFRRFLAYQWKRIFEDEKKKRFSSSIFIFIKNLHSACETYRKYIRTYRWTKYTDLLSVITEAKMSKKWSLINCLHALQNDGVVECWLIDKLAIWDAYVLCCVVLCCVVLWHF